MRNLRHSIYCLLRQSEGFFKADMVYVAKGGFWVTFGQGLTSLLSLLLIIVVANFLPKETYGLYKYIISLAGVFSIFTLTGMNRAVARAAATGQIGMLKASVKYQIKWNSLMMLALWGLSAYYFYNSNLVLAQAFLALGVFLPLTTSLNTYAAYLEGKRQFRLNNIFSVTSTALYVGGMLLAIIAGGETLSLVIAYSLTTFLSSLFFYLFTLKHFEPNEENPDMSFLKYGRELTFIGLMGPVVSQADKIILTHFWGPVPLAVYALAIAVPERATTFIKSWVGISFPKLAGKSLKEINSVFYKRIFQGLLIGAVFTLLYILVAPYLFKYLLPQYLEAVAYSQILAFSFIFAMPNRYVSLLLESQKMSRKIFIRGVTQNIIMISLYISLGIYGGIMGLVLAQVLNAFAGVLVNILIWRTNPSTTVTA